MSTGIDVGPLVQQLEEGVLAVGAGVAEHAGGGGVRRPAGRRRSTRLPLDSISSCCRKAGEQAQALGVGHDRADRPAQAVAVEDVGQRQQHRRVGAPAAPRGSGASIAARAGQQARRRPRSRAPTAQREARPPTRSNSGRRPSPRSRTPGRPARRTPGPCRARRRRRPGGCRAAWPRLARSQARAASALVRVSRVVKVLETVDHQGLGRVEAGQRLGELGRIDVGGEAQLDLRVERLQRLPDQPRAEVRAADADVDDGAERLAGARRACAPERTASAKARMAAARGLDLAGHRLARRPEVGARRAPAAPCAGPARPSEALTTSPANSRVARGLDAGGPAPGPASASRSASDQGCLERSSSRPAAVEAQARQPVRLGGEQVGDAAPARGPPAALQRAAQAASVSVTSGLSRREEYFTLQP